MFKHRVGGKASYPRLLKLLSIGELKFTYTIKISLKIIMHQLEISNLSKTYANGVKALKNVSLTIPTGLFGLLGPNGAGKSTLMRIIATLQEADEGVIKFNELNIAIQKNALRKVLGYLPQQFIRWRKYIPADLNAQRMPAVDRD